MLRRKDKHERAADRILRGARWRHGLSWPRVWGNGLQFAAAGLMFWGACAHEWRAIAVFALMDAAERAWRWERKRRSMCGVALYDAVKASYFGVRVKKGDDPLHGGVLVFPRYSRDVACEVASCALDTTYVAPVEVVMEIHNRIGIQSRDSGSGIEVRGPLMEVVEE